MNRERAKEIMEECIEDAGEMCGSSGISMTGRALIAVELFRARREIDLEDIKVY